jgi:hypothetical protein
VVEKKRGRASVAILRTSNCRAYKHPEFRITYDPAIVPVEADLRWFLGWLEQSIAQGKRFAPGQTCQIGWMLTEVRQGNDSLLSLWEPDMRAMPVSWTESVSNTLAHLRLQTDVVESVLSADALSYPSIRQSAIICTRLGQKDGLVMERTEPSGADSGWFFGCREKDHQHNDVAELLRVSLYEAAIRYAPQIVPYLALPKGVLIAVSKGVPAIFQDGELLDLKPGSFLAARHSG